MLLEKYNYRCKYESIIIVLKKILNMRVSIIILQGPFIGNY